MAKFTQCSECNQWHFSNENCKPAFKVYDKENRGDDDPKTVRAIDHEDAAIEYAAYYNSRHDYCLMGEEMEVEVEDSEGVRLKFMVGAEPNIQYNCREIEHEQIH